MSIHIGAKAGQIAKSILLPGDPLRATYIAENLLEGAVCFNEIRGMKGFTGTYKGRSVSVMGTGMGVPSHAIYVNELIREYGVQTLIRVGTAGALQPELKLGDIVLAMTASTDSQVNRLLFGGRDFAPCASFELLEAAYRAAHAHDIPVKVGGILTSDSFYLDDPDWWKIWAQHGILACEMESNALYTLAARYKVNALSILTVSDSLVTGEQATSKQREQGFTRMAELALEICG